MPPTQRESRDIEGLLGDLYLKKRWLDTVIEGLEQAIQSPELRLVQALQAAFDDGQTSRVDLAEDEELALRTLASQVPRRSAAMEMQSASSRADEAS